MTGSVWLEPLITQHRPEEVRATSSLPVFKGGTFVCEISWFEQGEEWT